MSLIFFLVEFLLCTVAAHGWALDTSPVFLFDLDFREIRHARESPLTVVISIDPL